MKNQSTEDSGYILESEEEKGSEITVMFLLEQLSVW